MPRSESDGGKSLNMDDRDKSKEQLIEEVDVLKQSKEAIDKLKTKMREFKEKMMTPMNDE